MKRYLPLLCAIFVVPFAPAQDTRGYGPAQPQAQTPQNVQAEPDGKCRVVRPGDVVHYELTIASVEYARAVYADLQMRLGHSNGTSSPGLPIPDFRNMGGGGVATRDAQVGSVYHFAFKVQPDTLSGVYWGRDVYVTVPEENEVSGRGRSVDVSHHTQKQIEKYCLNVISPLGSTDRPLVTNFKPGPIDRK